MDRVPVGVRYRCAMLPDRSIGKQERRVSTRTDNQLWSVGNLSLSSGRIASCTYTVELYVMRPEIRHLTYFLAAAEDLNFTRAARRLHIVPQALSSAIAQLEGILDARLFERSTRRVELTPAGMAYLPYAGSSMLRSKS
ncbi:MAG: transcriptional regulator, LysR family [Nocardia sp.]|uniref:LysR family transcriptional regulator n=1 Tax=Nocardia sp. TaxID=1821 RepID=UPI003455A791|nr:transcriptional regulator, LysR family [Nocardia sp.]